MFLGKFRADFWWTTIFKIAKKYQFVWTTVALWANIMLDRACSFAPPWAMGTHPRPIRSCHGILYCFSVISTDLPRLIFLPVSSFLKRFPVTEESTLEMTVRTGLPPPRASTTSRVCLIPVWPATHMTPVGRWITRAHFGGAICSGGGSKGPQTTRLKWTPPWNFSPPPPSRAQANKFISGIITLLALLASRINQQRSFLNRDLWPCRQAIGVALLPCTRGGFCYRQLGPISVREHHRIFGKTMTKACWLGPDLNQSSTSSNRNQMIQWSADKDSKSTKIVPSDLFDRLPHSHK